MANGRRNGGHEHEPHEIEFDHDDETAQVGDTDKLAPVTGHVDGADLARGARAIVVGPYSTRRDGREGTARSVDARLDEATGLARAIDLDIASAQIAMLSVVRPSTYLGKGKVNELGRLIAEEGVALAVLDCALTPVQQRNLEKAWSCKVIDRTGLILEIFGRRARTKEGALQVEFAHLSYQKSRLVRSWTHLERQRGGFGFLGGPGETQIEADRRVIQERMTRIERDLDTVKRTRALHRASRRRTPYPIVALVGYTNAGKSTLFNCLTRADVLAEDMLFATLDPTARVIRLPHGGRAILSDTVGFISDLPTMLIAAFRATLEDVIEADVVLHVRDIAHEDSAAQATDVEKILVDLGISSAGTGEDELTDPRVIEVWNKLDLARPDDRERLTGLSDDPDRPAAISALAGEGIDALLLKIERRLAQGRLTYVVTLDAAESGRLNWLYEEGEVIDRRHDDAGRTTILARVIPQKRERLERLYPGARPR